MGGLFRKRRSTKRTGNYAPKAWVDTIASQCDGLAGKRVLEVGCDPEGQFVSQVFRDYQPAEIVGMNLIAPDRNLRPDCRVEPGDIRETNYQDGEFDVVISSSAFEHICNFDVALAEMFRILKPGGYLFSHFGPIWSTSYGHHLWLTHEDRLYTYWNVHLPSFCHLLMTPEEVAASIADVHPPEVCRAIAEYVFHAPEQNQLFFEDYERIVSESAFETILFKGYDHPELAQRYNATVTPDTYRQLRAKYPERTHFSYDGITLLLTK